MRFLRNVSRYSGDALVLAGAVAIVYATSLWSVIAGWYAAGIMLVACGVLIEVSSRGGEG